jgi:hypothetical protein
LFAREKSGGQSKVKAFEYQNLVKSQIEEFDKGKCLRDRKFFQGDWGILQWG